MIALPSGVRVWLACGHTDMRKGMDGLAMLAQQVLNEDPFGGALFAFRGKRGRLVTSAAGEAPRLAFCWARLPKVPRA
jgi:transposase